jgi:hypothetical protein
VVLSPILAQSLSKRVWHTVCVGTLFVVAHCLWWHTVCGGTLLRVGTVVAVHSTLTPDFTDQPVLHSTYKGLDISIGRKEIGAGGILIRTIQQLERTSGTYKRGGAVVATCCGPCVSVDHMLSLCNVASIQELVSSKMKNDISVDGGDSKILYLLKDTERLLQPEDVHLSGRVGLHMTKASVAKELQIKYVYRNYRAFHTPRLIPKGRHLMVIALAAAGYTDQKIADIVGIRATKAAEYISLLEAGRKSSNCKPYFKKLSDSEVCSCFGAILGLQQQEAAAAASATGGENDAATTTTTTATAVKHEEEAAATAVKHEEEAAATTTTTTTSTSSTCTANVQPVKKELPARRARPKVIVESESDDDDEAEAEEEEQHEQDGEEEQHEQDGKEEQGSNGAASSTSTGESDAVFEQLPILQSLTEASWRDALLPEFKKPYFKSIATFLAKEEKAGKQIFPPKDQIWTAFNETPIEKVKVVILGQGMPIHTVRD